jgi:hypothetical protein
VAKENEKIIRLIRMKSCMAKLQKDKYKSRSYERLGLYRKHLGTV